MERICVVEIFLQFLFLECIVFFNQKLKRTNQFFSLSRIKSTDLCLNMDPYLPYKYSLTNTLKYLQILSTTTTTTIYYMISYKK